MGGKDTFIRCNFNGTFQLLEAKRDYLDHSDQQITSDFRFAHVSTDEVFGPIEQGAFDESIPYRPSSPLSVEKSQTTMRNYASNCQVTNSEKTLRFMPLLLEQFSPRDQGRRKTSLHRWLWPQRHVFVACHPWVSPQNSCHPI